MNSTLLWSIGALTTCAAAGFILPIGGRDSETATTKNTGDSREEALAKLRKLLGANPQTRPVSDLYLRDLLKRRS